MRNGKVCLFVALVALAAAAPLSAQTLPTASGAHCVAADSSGNVFVCDPAKGRLLAFHDRVPASR